jgi:ankyrin repeat protein
MENPEITLKAKTAQSHEYNRNELGQLLSEMRKNDQSLWYYLPKDLVAPIANYVLFDAEFKKYQNPYGLFNAIYEGCPFVAQLLATGAHKDAHNKAYPETDCCKNKNLYEKNKCKNPNCREGLKNTTPLCIASNYSHYSAIMALLANPDIEINKAGSRSTAMDNDPFMKDKWAKNMLSPYNVVHNFSYLTYAPHTTYKWQRENFYTYEIEATPLHCVSNILGLPQDSNALFYNSISWENAQNTHIIPALIQAGADIEAKDRVERTPLYCAVAAENRQTVQLLLNLSADPNNPSANNIFPLHVAARLGNSDIIRLLVQYKAQINAQDECGRTALYCAVQAAKSAAVKTLLELGADPNIDLNSFTGATPLIAACKMGNINLVTLLLEAPTLDITNTHNQKALCITCYYGHEKVFDVLLKTNLFGINKRHRFASKTLMTPLRAAVLKQCYPIVAKLLECPDIDLTVKGNYEDNPECYDTAYECAQKMNDDAMMVIFPNHKQNREQQGCLIQ